MEEKIPVKKTVTKRIKPSTNPQETARIHPELVTLMREIYSKYTGYEIAAVFALIRREFNEREELEKRKEMLAKLGIKG